jgi:hypothetical protein
MGDIQWGMTTLNSTAGAIATGGVYDAMAQTKTSISVRADIRGSFQRGAKIIQNVSLSASGDLKSLGNYVGYTDLGISWPGYGEFSAEKTGSFPVYNVNLEARAVAAPIAAAAKLVGAPAPAIHYAVGVKVNFASHMASMSTIHSAYPSLSVRVNGHSPPLYDYRERFMVGGLLPMFDVHAYVPDHPW